MRSPVRPRVKPGIILLHLILIALCMVAAFPLFWMISTALKTPEEIFSPEFRILPRNPTLSNFPAAFGEQPVGAWIFNSVVIAVAITAGKLLVSVPAAYAFARHRFRGRSLLFAVVVGTMIVPDAITIVPNYIFISDLDWLNTPQGVIVPSIAFTGFFVFLLRQSMLSLPQELFDAARVDGAGTLRILWSIVLPLVRPALAIVTVLSFLSAWNLYLWPLLILEDVDTKTLAVGMQYFFLNTEIGTSNASWGPLMAVAALAMLPPLLLFLFAQKSIVSAFVDAQLKR